MPIPRTIPMDRYLRQSLWQLGFWSGLILFPQAARAAEPFEFQPSDRVVFVGAGLVERMQYDGYLETMLTVACAEKNLTFRNLGWSGDTVWGDSRGVFGSRAEGFKRLVKDVTEAKPTVLAICYGENEAYAGEAGLADFRAGLNALLDALRPTNARVLLIVPPPHENLGPPLPDPQLYNADLAKYAEVIAAVARERGAGLIAPVAMRGAYPSELTTNGFQFTKLGAWLWARDAGRRLGLISKEGRPMMEIDASQLAVVAARRATVSDLAWDGKRLSFTAAESPLVMPPLPLPASQVEANPPLVSWPGASRVLQVSKLPAGNYQLVIDGKPVATVDHETLAQGYEFDDEAARKSVATLQSLCGAKNELYFHRYRPQNETYLFLFRKHEQGNNAIEIPQFDPLIAEKEWAIANLCQPVKRKYELVKTNE